MFIAKAIQTIKANKNMENEQDKKKKQLAFILKNVSSVYGGELDKIYQSTLKTVIKDKLDVHANSECFGSGDTSVFDLNETLTENGRRYREWLRKNDISEKDFLFLYHNLQIFKWYYFQPNASGKNWNMSSNSGRPHLNHLIYSLITGEADDKAYAISLGLPTTELSTLVIYERVITIKYFQSGRVDITGLTENEVSRIIALRELTRKLWTYPERKRNTTTVNWIKRYF